MSANKSEIREVMRARRREVSPAARIEAAALICRKVVTRVQGGVCAVYLAAADEIDLSAAISVLLARGISVVAPRWMGETYMLARVKSLTSADLRKGPMTILEPKDAELVAPQDVTTWLVPGLAFTREGERLGYGGGWYDRLLAEANPQSVKLGIAYAFQIVDALPCEAHDRQLTEILTDRNN